MSMPILDKLGPFILDKKGYSMVRSKCVFDINVCLCGSSVGSNNNIR